MPVSEEYLDYVVDQLGCIGEVAAKRMFGGVGLYHDGLFFGLIAAAAARKASSRKRKKKSP